MKAPVRFVAGMPVLSLFWLASLGSACSKGRDAVAHGTGAESTLAIAAPKADCGHAACADNFFIDAAPGDCAAGSVCNVALTLVATGDFHINDEYPYRFKADDAAGVEFLGTDANGKNSFSKAAGDWQKTAAKSGTLTVKFAAKDAGTKTVGGTLKLSVCSAQACLLEQRQVTASVLAK